ncbi:MAG: alpha/beta hydrolase [Rhizobacter sp.]
MNFNRLAQGALLAATLIVGTAASAVQIGPAPTASSLAATSGPFTVRNFTVSRPSGYGAGTVYYPVSVGSTVGAIAVVPGYTARQSDVNWWGPRMASWGFVVIVIDTNSTLDQPDSRSRQQLAALDQVATLSRTSSSPIYNLVDTARMGVMGWSMGGGGSLISTKNRTSLKASIPFAPWNSSTNFSSVTTPTFIIACQSDSIAPVNSHALPFYNSLSRPAKVFMEMRGESHYCGNTSTSSAIKQVIGAQGVAWMKRYIDGDTRFTSFACSNPNNSTRVSDFRSARCS